MNRFWTWFDDLNETDPTLRFAVLFALMTGTVLGIPFLLQALGVDWVLTPLAGMIVFTGLAVHKAFFYGKPDAR